MTDLDLAAIRERAEAATPGPWTWYSRETEDGCSWAVFDRTDAAVASNNDGWRQDAEHIAGMNPQTTLALCDEIDRLNATIQRVREIVTDPQTVGWIERDGDTAWIPAERIREALGIPDEPLSKRHPAMSREDLRRALEGGES